MAAPSGTNASNSQFEALHRELLSDRSLQFKFEDAQAPPAPPDWLEPLARFIEFIAPYFVYIFWAGVIVVAAIIIYTIAVEFLRRLPQASKLQDPNDGLPSPEFRPAKTRAHTLLEEADRLAREGRYAEAVRLLLHRSIEDMDKVFPGEIAPSMTSREIEIFRHLSAQGRSTFTKIARTVEASLFAGRVTDRQQFSECRHAYESFAFEAPSE